MKIAFDKVSHTAKPFREAHEGVVLEGILQKKGEESVTLLGEMEGIVILQCNRCGVSFNHTIATPIKLTLSNQIVEDKDDLDIIEFLDGGIDISFILQSEINTIKSEYHYCDICAESEEAFEMEF